MNKLQKQQTISSRSKSETQLNDEINDNEEILTELDVCLKNKTAFVSQLKHTISTVEADIKTYSSYNSENATLEEDVSMFRSIAGKYVKPELVNFYIDRMRKSAANEIASGSSTVSALCESISRDGE